MVRVKSGPSMFLLLLSLILLVYSLSRPALSSLAIPYQTSVSSGEQVRQRTSEVSFPPPKDYCGEDLVELYAIYLVSETLGSFIAEDPSLLNRHTPLVDQADEMTLKKDQLSQRLEDKNCYFYGERGLGKGSVFGDYKAMRDAKFVYADKFRYFRLDMSLEEAMQVARVVVSSWW